jgi:hypothetical protein
MFAESALAFIGIGLGNNLETYLAAFPGQRLERAWKACFSLFFDWGEWWGSCNWHCVYYK